MGVRARPGRLLGWASWPGLLAVAAAAAAAAVALVPGLSQPAAAAAEPGGVLVPPLPAPLIVVSRFAPPARPWLAGNRGVDLAANTGAPVFAATTGVVVYAGELVGRGVISISSGGLHVTYEPVEPVVRAGERVGRGQLIGRVSAEADSCGPPGSCLHWGVRAGAAYLNPMALLGHRPRVRLLPIWAGGLPSGAVRRPTVGAAPPADSPAQVPAESSGDPRAPTRNPGRGTARTTLVAGGAAVLGGATTFGAAAVAARRGRVPRGRGRLGLARQPDR